MKKNLFSLAAALLLFTACETEVNPELNSTLNILVVDDNLVNRIMVERFLEKWKINYQTR